jgi:peptide/nickel transport system substrate-binding protein
MNYFDRSSRRGGTYQPYLNLAMQKNVAGYRYWFQRQLDCRTLAKA